MFSAYSTEDSYEEDSEEQIMFTVEDTFKDVFTVEDTERSEAPDTLLEESKDLVLPKETVVSSGSEADKPSEEQTVDILSESTIASSEPETLTLLEEAEVILEEESPPIEEGSLEGEEEPEVEGTESLLTGEEVVGEGIIEEVAVLEETEIPKPNLEVLIVIDNSGSMKFILRGIGRKMQMFKEILNPFGYRIAFLSAKANPNQDKVLMDLEYRGQIFTQQNFLEPEMDNQILIDTLVRGKGDKCDRPPYCGGRSERPLGALEAYLFSPDTDAFIRTESEGLAVVLITDNEENRRSKDEPATTAEDVINIFNQRYPSKNFKAYTLTVLDKECQREIRRRQFPFREGHFAPTVVELAEQTGGRNFSLCLPSYQEVAEQIMGDFSFSK